MSLTTDTNIIFVHGLASKPSKDRLLSLWRHALIENVRCDNKPLANAMENNTDLFQMAYWANAVPDHIEDTTAYYTKLCIAVDDVIKIRRDKGTDLHIGAKGWIKSKIKMFGLDVLDTLGTALTIKDNIVEQTQREIRLYHGDQYIADKIRESIEAALRNAWDAGKYTILITHSMGTFVAYDVLWRFSHRTEERYRKYRSNMVDLFITMGSPLGDPAVKSYMLIDRWKNMPTNGKNQAERQRYYPTNIGAWENYSAYGDIVSHDTTLEDDFFNGLREHVGGYRGVDLRDYVKLFNPFITTSKKRNPHKSYGYLIQPKLSYNMQRFFDVE